MLSQTAVLWTIGYPLYVYGSIFVIILFVWQVTRRYHGVRPEPKKRCYRHHRKVRQRARASRAKRFAQGEAEMPQKLLSVMKSQGWLPQEKSVRQLLCTDSKCKICNAVALEIEDLLKADTNHFSTTLLGPSGIKLLPRSSGSFEQNLGLHSQNSGDISLPTVTPRQTPLTKHLAQPTNAVGIQEYWAGHLHPGQDIQLLEVSLGSGIMASRFEETGITVNEQEMQVTPNCVQRHKQQYHLKAQDSFLLLTPNITNQTLPIALHIKSVLPTHLPFLCPEVLRLLEVHVKKWIHFQKWGLPRRVENSLRELMPNPPLFCLSRKNLQPSCFPNGTSKVTTDKTGTISYQSWHSCLAGQHTKTLWISEWSLASLGKRVQQNTNRELRSLPCRAVAGIHGHCPLPERQTNGSRSNVWKRYHQLFCGLPSLHSESLVAIFLGPQHLPRNMSKPSLKDLHLFKDLSYLPFLSQPCLALPHVSSSPPCPNGESPTHPQEAPIAVPFLTQAECEALEWHLLQRQLQLQWGLPAAFQRPQHAQSPMQCEMCNKAQSLKIQKTLQSEKLSILTREHFFFPEHARRLLGFHLQKHLIHLRWGLPEKIQKSIQLLLSSTGQQPLSWSSRALPNVSTSQPGAPEAKGDGCVFSPMMSQVSVPMPHLFVQAQAMLQSHIDSKCGQIHQGKVPVLVHSSWECRIPGVLAMAPLADMLQGQPLELQAASDPDLYHKLMPCEPMALGQQQQALSNTTAKHHKLLQTLPEETVEKLETTLRHKYLAFLSGLPVVYYVGLSRVKPLATTSQSIVTEMVPTPIKIPSEPLAKMFSLESSLRRPGLCFQDDNKPWKGTAEKSQLKVQVEAETEMAPPKGQIHSASYPFKVHKLAKLNFHLKKKVLEIHLGIPEGAKKSRDPHAAVPENISTQEGNQSKQHQGNTALQELPTPLHSPPTPASEWLHPKEKQASEPQAMQHNQKHPSLKAVPHGFVPWGSEIPQLGGDMPEAQVLCVQVQTNVSNPSLEKPRSPEPQSPGKSKDSAHVSMLARKREDPGKLEAAGDFGGRDAGFGLSSAMEEVQPLKFHGKVQRPEGILLNKTPQGSWRWKYGFHPVKPCQQNSQAKLPKPLLRVPRGRDSEHDLPHRQTKPNGILSPERIPNNAQPVVAQAPQGQPFLDQTTQDQPLQSPACKGRVLKGPKMPAHILKEARLADTGLRGKIKSFRHCVNPEMTGKGHLESTSCTAGKEAKPRTQNVLSSLARTPSPTKRTKTEKAMEHPKVQSAPTEKSVGAASFLSGPPSPGNKLRLRSRPQGSASVRGHQPHCAQHCPPEAK